MYANYLENILRRSANLHWCGITLAFVYDIMSDQYPSLNEHGHVSLLYDPTSLQFHGFTCGVSVTVDVEIEHFSSAVMIYNVRLKPYVKSNTKRTSQNAADTCTERVLIYINYINLTN